MQKLEQIYEGKAKKVFKTDDPELLIVDYKDDATAFNSFTKARQRRFSHALRTLIMLSYPIRTTRPHSTVLRRVRSMARASSTTR